MIDPTVDVHFAVTNDAGDPVDELTTGEKERVLSWLTTAEPTLLLGRGAGLDLHVTRVVA